MEKFNITTDEGVFTVEPQENGTYRIFQEEDKVGVVYAEPSEQGTQWRTMDELDDRLVIAIGAQIAEHNNN